MDATLDTIAASTPVAGATQPFAWQGWRMRVPVSWNPVALEGDFFKGHALLAEAGEPRLGVRWRPAKDMSAAVLRRAIRDEVGDEAAACAKPLPDPDTDPDVPTDHLHYEMPETPGRDVHVWHAASNRFLQLVYHAAERDDVLRGQIIPTLADCSFLSARPWAVLGLSCAVPAVMRLTSKRLNAGDLTLAFTDRKRFVTVRQIALARIALSRTPLTAWLVEQQRARRMRFRVVGVPSDVSIEADDGRTLRGIVGRMRRRRRFCWSWRTPTGSVTFALHDAARDRLVIVEASDEVLARDVAKTVGQA